MSVNIAKATVVGIAALAMLGAAPASGAYASQPKPAAADAFTCHVPGYCGPFGSQPSCEGARAGALQRGLHAPNPCFYYGGGGVSSGWYFYIF